MADEDRPVFHPEMGQLFTACRTAKRWSVHQAVIAARGKGHSALTDNKLRWLEEGKTKAPDQDVLRAVTDVYGLDYLEIAGAFIKANYGVDLLRHATDQRSELPTVGGSADVPASARRIAQLESELTALKAKFGDVQDVARRLFAIAVGDEGRAAAATPTGRRRPTRKTR